MVKAARLIRLLVILLVLVPAGTALAHSPIFPGENHTPATAYTIDNPAKSWAIYDTLDHPDEGEYYSFDLSRGDRIQLSLITPEDPSVSGFLPSLALLIPGQARSDETPEYIEIPDGYGATLLAGRAPEKVSYEAFSPGWFYEVANMNSSAPADGTYYVVVFGSASGEEAHSESDDHGSPDHEHGPANYCLVVGYIESFTPLELIMVPFNLQTVYTWEGQSQVITLLPFILVLVIGAALFYWRYRRGSMPKGVSKWLASLAGLAFLGSAVSILYQMLLTFSVTGVHGEAVITLIFLVFSVALGVVALLYALRQKPALTAWRRVVLIIIAVIALFVWSGLYLGSALAIAAALVPPYSRR